MILVQILIGLSLASVALSAQCVHPIYGYHGWAGWSSCTQTCGGGTRTRYCSYDNTHETEPCNLICLNGGEYHSGFCHCRHGTHGPCCDDILECRSHPCQNGGTCHEYINYYSCTCPPGTTGLNCYDIPECASNPCQNGGTCVEHVNHYTCVCPPGTTGPNCDDIPDCLSNPCLNGGTCEEHVNYYTCQCPAGTIGYNCVDIPECASSPCQNGATCNEMINMYNCSCLNGYIGVHCEKDLFMPHEHSCRYGGHSGCYVVFRRKDTWQEAEEFCEARQGHLAVPNDIDEVLYIENFLDTLRGHFSDARFWIGAHNVASGPIQWVTAEDSSVTRWPDGTDHTLHGTECVLMDGSYNFEWQAIACGAQMYFVCEESQLFNILG